LQATPVVQFEIAGTDPSSRGLKDAIFGGDTPDIEVAAPQAGPRDAFPLRAVHQQFSKGRNQIARGGN
jgi:hypothetical protein